MLQQVQPGPIGCRGCSGSGEHALAATQSNLSQARRTRLTGSSLCSRCGRFAACFAGGVTTGFHTVRGVSILISDWIHNSNDLLRCLMSKHSSPTLNYQIVAQSAEDVQNTENAPAVSIAPFLLASGQTDLLRTISIYSVRGESREQIRLLYMNAPAIRVWRSMGKAPNVVGSQARPPHTALLTFGVPYSE